MAGAARRPPPTPRSARCSPSCAARSARACSPAAGELRLHPGRRTSRSTSRRRGRAPSPAPRRRSTRRLGRGGRRARARRARRRPADLPARLPTAPWAAEQRRELETIRLRALEALAEAGLRQGGRELGAAEQAARAAIAAAPFRESAHRLLMEVHEAAGNPAEALRAFEELRLAAARGARDHARAGGDGRARARAARRAAAGRAPAAPAPAPRRSPVTAWPAPLAAARRAATRWSAARASSTYLERCWREAVDGTRAARAAGRRRRHRQDARWPPSWPRARTTTARVVLYGRFDEETLAPYQPVVEMLRGWSAGRVAGRAARARSARAPPSSAILLPEFGAAAGRPRSRPAAAATTADAQRYRFFDAVAALLGEIGAEAPVVLVFDDLHWADRPTLQLLRHLVRAPAPAPRAVPRHLPREPRSPTATRCTS